MRWALAIASAAVRTCSVRAASSYHQPTASPPGATSPRSAPSTRTRSGRESARTSTAYERCATAPGNVPRAPPTSSRLDVVGHHHGPRCEEYVSVVSADAPVVYPSPSPASVCRDVDVLVPTALLTTASVTASGLGSTRRAPGVEVTIPPARSNTGICESGTVTVAVDGPV